MAKKVFKSDSTATSWGTVMVDASTQCKHGTDDCAKCGTRASTDIVHTSRTPNKRTLRRLKRKGKL